MCIYVSLYAGENVHICKFVCRGKCAIYVSLYAGENVHICKFVCRGKCAYM